MGHHGVGRAPAVTVVSLAMPSHFHECVALYDGHEAMGRASRR